MYSPVTPVLSSTGTAVDLPAASVKNSRLVGRLLERARDPQADHAFLVVVEHDRLIERRQGRDPIDRCAIAASPRKTNCVCSWSSGLPSAVTQSISTVSSPSIVAAFALDDLPMQDRAHLLARGLDGVGVVPEVEAVHVTVVQPQADVMRMIDSLTLPRFEREAARHDRPLAVRNG